MNELAGMMARGFSDMQEKLASKNELVGLEGKTATKQQLIVLKEDMDNQFTAVNQRLTKVEDRLDEMREILTRFEKDDVLDLQNRIKILERTVRAMSKRLL